MDGQRILKLLLETSCAVPEIGVEISSPPGTVTGEGETPSHRQRTTPGFRARRSLAPPARRKLRATGAGETPGHPVLGRLWGLWSRQKPGATRQEGSPQGWTLSHRRRGKTSMYVAEGKPRVMCGEESSGPSAKGKLQVMRRRGNPESRNAKKALSHPAKGKLEPFGLGETPVIW